MQEIDDQVVGTGEVSTVTETENESVAGTAETEEVATVEEEAVEEKTVDEQGGTPAEEAPVEEMPVEATEPVGSEDDKELPLQKVMDSLGELNDKIEQMNKLFVQKIQHTTHEEKIVDQMHAELQKYKEDMYSQLVRPILLDIIDIRDSIVRMSNSFAAKPEGEQSVPLKTFSDYALDLQDVLEKNNITIYDSKDGDDFNALKQKIVKKATTPVEQLHGKVAESLSSGYDYMGRTISPEKVVVYIYQKPEEAEGEN